MKIGNRTLDISTPADLDEKLIEATGCSAKELRAMLEGPMTPSLMGKMLTVFAKDPPHYTELAESIAKAGSDQVRADMRDLFDKASGKKGGASGNK